MSGDVKINRRMYLTADGARAVEEGDPDAATLLCTAGGYLPHATAARYGLLQGDVGDDPQPEPEPEKGGGKAEESDAKAETDDGEAEGDGKTTASAPSKDEDKADPPAPKRARRPADKSRTPGGDK